MLEHSYLVAFAKGFAITQTVEVPLVWYLLSRHLQRVGSNAKGSRIIAGAFFANMATLPYLWFIYPEFLDFAATVAVGETTALVAEALFYHLLLGTSLRAAFIVSLAANASSVMAGLILMPPFRW